MEPAALYQRDTAGRHLVRRVPAARAGDTVVAVLAGLPGREYDAADAV